MSRATSLIAKVNAVLRKTGPMLRLAYKRTYVTTGGDALIGQPGSVVPTDVLMDPQPFYSRLGREHLPGGHMQFDTTVDTAGRAVLADEYVCIISPTAMSLAELQNNNITLVFKAGADEEIFTITDFESPAMNGQDVVYVVYLRSRKVP